MCGGFFVKAVNQGLTRCADGTLQIECYVASFSNKKNLDLSLATLVRGDIKPKKYRGFGNLGIFVVAEAYSPATEAVVTEIGSESIFVGLENNSIVCITTPCFPVDQYLLNRKKIRTISDINLNGVGASKAVLGQALSIMSTGGVLIASGIDQQTKGVGGKGVAFVADQFYLPVEAAK
jgi:hypothetical protein